jgi:6-pyruvoyltetrahydropterin/6-carboxytetrahydropterin synthase
MHTATKVMDGYSTVFRQWKATTTHCSFLHGYDIYFTLNFVGDLDERNWVYDFGGFKRATAKIHGMNPKEWFDHMFDHTTIVAFDDPGLALFEKMANCNMLQLRVVEAVGAEKFAELVYNKISAFLDEETQGRVKLESVTCHEHHKNSATYRP